MLATLAVFAAVSAGFAAGSSVCLSAAGSIFSALAILAALGIFSAGTISAAVGFGTGGAVVFAALVEVAVSGFRSFYRFGIVAGSSNGLLYFNRIGSGRTVVDHQLLAVGAPGGKRSTGSFGCGFDLLFTHTAVTRYIEGIALGLSKRNGGESNENKREEKCLKRFHDNSYLS